MAVQDSSLCPIDIKLRYLLMKRIIDVVFTLSILPILCIINVIVALLIRLDSEGPILYRQRRVGKSGVEFEMLKFRSMFVNSNDTIHREAVTQFMNGQKLNGVATTDLPYKKIDDPRITRVGRFLRKTSLDELPQFWNVLRGDMSLVGPRPSLFYEVELYNPQDWLRLSGKPGLTGRWQIYGRSRVTYQEMIEMDIAYLQHQSLWEDLKLIALTIPVMIQRRGGV